MTRSEKSSHQLELHIASQNSGYVTEEIGKPVERRARIAELGHAMMTTAEYRREIMHRKTTSADRRDVAISKMQGRRGRR